MVGSGNKTTGTLAFGVAGGTRLASFSLNHVFKLCTEQVGGWLKSMPQENTH